MPLYKISWLKILESMAHWGKPIIPLNFSDRHKNLKIQSIMAQTFDKDWNKAKKFTGHSLLS